MPRITRTSPKPKVELIDPYHRAVAAHIGAKLFALRQKRQVSQRDVATKAGLSVSFFCDMENGKRSPSAATLYLLSQAFEVSMNSWFVGFEFLDG